MLIPGKFYKIKRSRYAFLVKYSAFKFVESNECFLILESKQIDGHIRIIILTKNFIGHRLLIVSYLKDFEEV